jgi:short-subunit dehydrogenase
MVNEDRGKEMFSWSTAAMMPGSYRRVYNASTSFIRAVTEAVRDELRGAR